MLLLSAGCYPFPHREGSIEASGARPSFDVVAGVEVRFCDLLDCADCLALPATGPPAAISDAAGVAALELPYAAEGCFALSRDGFTSTLFYPGHPLTSALPQEAIGLVREGSLSALAQQQGLPHAPGQGAVFARQFDCFVHVGIDARFASSELPDATWAYTDRSQPFDVDLRGDTAVVVGHPASTTTVTASVAGAPWQALAEAPIRGLTEMGRLSG
jgi:hypothetical protein